MQNIYELITNKIDKSQVKLNEPMNKHTSFKIGGPADIFVKVNLVIELMHVIVVAKQTNTPLTVIRQWNKFISKRPEEFEE